MTLDPLVSVSELEELSAAMEAWSPQEILKWTADLFGRKVAMATAFGVEGCALIAMLATIPNSTHVFNLETGYQFPETMKLRNALMEKYGIFVHLVKSDESVEEMEHRYGGPIYSTDPDQCCNNRKVIPLKQAIKGYAAWITAIRRDQSSSRSTAPVIGYDQKFDLIKINPLANWSKKDVWDYVVKNNVPYNPLYDQGFASIGCWPCTRAVGAGEDERAGRWSGFAKKECGLHTQSKDGSSGFQRLTSD